MKAVLRGISGPALGAQALLEGEEAVTVGRNVTCSLAAPNDKFLSGRHFEVSLQGDSVVLRDLGSSNGTFVGGERVLERELAEGDVITAGGSTFHVRVARVYVPTVAEALSGQAEPLYAVLDAARDPAIYPMLLGSGAQFWCLYAGESARKLETVAPYLVMLPPRSELLNQLVAKAWGKSWGTYLTSAAAPETVWHELRRSLMVGLEGSGKFVYFRFYDPRVLRVFLPTADAAQLAEFTGTIGGFFMEDEDGSFLWWRRTSPLESKLKKIRTRALSKAVPVVSAATMVLKVGE